MLNGFERREDRRRGSKGQEDEERRNGGGHRELAAGEGEGEGGEGESQESSVLRRFKDRCISQSEFNPVQNIRYKLN